MNLPLSKHHNCGSHNDESVQIIIVLLKTSTAMPCTGSWTMHEGIIIFTVIDKINDYSFQTMKIVIKIGTVEY